MTTLNDKITALMAAGIDHATIVAAILADETPIPTDASNDKASEPTTTTTNKETTTVDTYHRSIHLDADLVREALATRKGGSKFTTTAPEAWLYQGALTFAKMEKLLRTGSCVYVTRKGRKILVQSDFTPAPTAPAPAPAPTDEIPLAERVCVLLESAPRVKVTPQQVAEKLGITVRQARTQLNVLTNNNRPSPRHGRIVRVTDGVYACARRA